MRHAAVAVVFKDMTVTLPTDGICAVLGRSGSGRTSLLRLLSGMERPQAGRILTNTRFSPINNAASFFNAGLTGHENIVFIARLYGMNPAVLSEIVLDTSKFGTLWDIPAGAVPGPRKRAMEMLVGALLPFDCYLIDDIERTDPETFMLVLQILRQRRAGLIFTVKNQKFAREFATSGGVIADQTVYAFPTIDEALHNYV